MVLLTGHGDGELLLLLSSFVLGETRVDPRVFCARRAEHQIHAVLIHAAFGGHALTRPLPPHLRLGISVRRLAGDALQRVRRKDARLLSLHVIDF